MAQPEKPTSRENLNIKIMKQKLLLFISFLALSKVGLGQIDMTITNITISPGTTLGYNNDNSFNVTLKNIGADSLKQTLNTEVFLSRDQVYDANDLILANQVTSNIAPGGEQIINLSTPFSYGGGNVPIAYQTYPPGIYYIIAKTNFYYIIPNGGLQEPNKTNNEFILATTLAMPNTDLKILSATIPDSVILGRNSLDYSYLIDGTDKIGVNYSDAFFLSKDSILNVGDIRVGGFGNGKYDVGQTITWNDIKFDIPLQTLAGYYYLIVALDNATSNNVNITLQDRIAETNENNNIIKKRIYVKGLDVDIALQSIVGDDILQSGSSVPVIIATKNTGKVNVVGFKNKYYFSTDAVIDASDIVFSTTTSGSATGLVAGNSVNENINLFINANTPSGNYYIIAVADADNVIAETNESNNILIKQIQVVAPFRDIAISSFSSNTNPINVSTSFFTSAVFKNNGSLATGNFGVNIYLSTDSIISVNDLKINSNLLSVTSVNGNATRNVTFSSVTIPSTVSSGSYFLILEADASNLVAEKFEDNNIASTRVNVVGFNYDLAINSIDLFPANVANNGSTVAFNYTMKNNSNTIINTFNSALYLSTDSVYDGSDPLLTSSNRTGTVAIGGTSVVGLGFSIANSVIPGTYYLIVKTDGNNAYNETNETNNFGVVRINVAAPFRDLTTQFLTDTVKVIRSVNTDVTYRIVNVGNIISTGGQQIRLFLSTDNVLSTSTDQEIISFNITNSIAAGDFAQYVRTLNLANPVGTYYLFAVADFNNVFVESNENNNANYTVIKLEERVVDLSAVSDTAKYVVKLNNISRSFPVKIRNIGNSDVQSVLVQLYLSNDSTTGISGKTLIGSVNAFVGQNTSSAVNFNYIFNSSTNTPGKKYLVYVVDAGNTLAETNENNNYVIVPVELKAMSVDLIVSAASTTVDAVVTNEVVSGNGINITASMSNIGTDNTVSNGITLAIYYSEDSLYQTTDTYIGQGNNTGPNGTSNVLLAIPTNATVGKRFLIFYADRNNVVIESNENNNVLAIPIKVLDRTYDFFANFTNINPSDSITAGTSKVITYSGTNTTNFISGNVAYSKIYLSKDTIYDVSDIDVVGNVSLATNSANNSVSTNATINIPVNQVGGNFYLIGYIDYNNGVAETNEANNFFRRPIRIVERKLDLKIDSVRFVNGNEFVLGSTTPSITVRYGNFGNVAASFSNFPIIRILLSQDNVVDNGDVVLRNYSIPYGSMPLNARYTESVSFTIPANTAVGLYKLIVVMDANNVFAETNEVNNTTVYNYRISTTETDYAPDTCTFSSSAVKSGDVIMVNTKIANLGNTTTGQISYRLYWSTDDKFDVSDLSRSTNVLVSTIAPRSVSVVSSTSIAIPTVSNGIYHVICVADALSSIVETNENNNVKAFAIIVSNVITTTETESRYDELVVYPNPTSDKLFVSKKSENTAYTIFNSLGAEIEKGTVSGNSINVSQLDNGVYHLQLSGNDKTSRMKFIKQ